VSGPGAADRAGPKRAAPGLRVAIATDGPVRLWQAQCAEALVAISGVTIVRWIQGPVGGTRSDPRILSGALSIVPVPPALAAVRRDGEPPGDESDGSAGSIDVLLDLAERGQPTAVGWAREVWRFGYGRELTRNASLVALRDYVRGPGVTRVALISEPSGAILRDGWLQTVSWWKGAPMEAMLLEPASWPAAAALDRMDPGPLGGARPADRTIPDGRSLTPPRPLLLVAAIARRAIGAPDSLMGRDDWNVGVLPGPIEQVLISKQRPEIRWLPTVPGHYAADPFGLERDGTLHVFYEDFDHGTHVGSICHVSISRDGTVTKPESVLNPGVHASYPFLVERDGEVFMLPETSAAGELVLYQAADFPRAWRPAATLLKKIPVLDASVIEYEGRWWMFATRKDRGGDQNLFVWHAPELFGPWVSHAANPVKTDARTARPGGTPFIVDGQLYRPSQDDSLVYGGRVVVNRVDVLTTREFAECPVTAVEPQRGSAYPNGLHTLSSAGANTLVDGNSRRLTLGTLREAAERRLPRRRTRH
jgi:hypothetical protein